MRKKFPYYRQLDSMDCGPSCLKMITKYYGREYSIQYLRENSFINREGVSMLGISDAAETIGFRTTGLRVSFDRLMEDMTFPCILYWQQNHFVVCSRIKKIKRYIGHNSEMDYRIYISDPAEGQFVLNEKEFQNKWINSCSEGIDTGLALSLIPSPLFYEKNTDIEIRKRNIVYFLKYLKPYRSQILQLIVGMLLGSILQLILPFLTQAVVDQGIRNNNLSLITLILISQLILFSTQLAVDFIRNWITLHMNARINITLISDFLIKLMKLPLRFFDTKNIGDILQRIGDHSRIETFLTGSTLTTIFSFGNFFIFAIVLGYYNMGILGIFLLGNMLYILWILFFMRYRRAIDYKRFSQAAAEQGNLVHMITGMQEIKLNNIEKEYRWKWERIQIKLFEINIKGLSLEQYQKTGTLFFSQTTSLFISFLAARLVINGDITLGMMLSISYIIGQLSAPISQIISFSQSFQDAKISLERLNEIHNSEDEEQTIQLKNNYIPDNKSICIENICFSYNGSDREYILNNVSLLIPQQKVTAIVGASGSGKTTLIKLLLGFYLPNKGTIKIGDTALNDINPHLWRRKNGTVMQDGFIFSDTIAHNIAIGTENIDKKKLIHAVEAANIRDFIESLPLKYDTKIGMEGNGISQGQRQRILIARAVYKDPDFIFLDEATNALDANNERIILDNLMKFYKGKTVVIIAHRLSTVQHADNIVVLDNGTIIEEGSHLELVAQKGAYYTLVKNQLELGI